MSGEAATGGPPRALAPRSPGITAALLILTVLLLVAVVLSLRWRAVQDAPIMLYLAFLMDHFGYAPYRDFFDLNLPGTFLINMGVGRLFGYHDFGLRCGDVLYLGAILAATYAVMRRFGRQVAWCGCVLFGLVYLGHGPYVSMQREYLMILPVALALLAWARVPAPRAALRAALVGLFVGAAATVRPQAAMFLPWMLFILMLDRERRVARRRSSGVAVAAFAVVGFATPIVAMSCYLSVVGSLGHLVDIALNYWPLHGRITGDHHTISGGARVPYLIRGIASLGSYRLWVVPALVGACASYLLPPPPAGRFRLLVALLAGMTVLCAVYPAFAGQFWEYHWLPFGYFIILLSSLCLSGRRASSSWAIRWVPPVLLLVVVLLRVTGPEQVLNHRRYVSRVENSRLVDEIAALLTSRVGPGDTVQPLDWTVAAVHAMLLARAEIATPFVYDYHFFLYPTHPYVKALRQRFLADIRGARPRVIVHMEPGVPRVMGSHTTSKFRRLERLLESEYSRVAQGDRYVVYERASAVD